VTWHRSSPPDGWRLTPDWFQYPQDSGRVSGNLRRPKRFNRRLRRVFYVAALSSLRTGGPSRQFYDRKRSERLVHSQALLTPWRGASSTCCRHCYATAANSPSTVPAALAAA
jgi:hypothetical protein